MLVDVIDEPRDRIRIGIGPDAVTEIEDMSGRVAGCLEHRIGVSTELARWCEECSGVEIALNGFSRT